MKICLYVLLYSRPVYFNIATMYWQNFWGSIAGKEKYSWLNDNDETVLRPNGSYIRRVK
jgi:hypothetical protein